MEGSFNWNFEPDSADNVLITRTFAAAVKTRHWLGKVFASYEAVPTGDTYLTIAWTRNGVAKSLPICINVLGPVPFDFAGIIKGDPNTSLVLTLTASGAAGNVAKLNTFYQSFVAP